MARRRVENPLALAVFCCLTERPMHPYEISSALRSRGKELSIKLNYGSLYSVVESMQKHGLISRWRRRGKVAVPSGRCTRSPTPGSFEREDWLAELLSTPVREFTSLEAGLSMMPRLAPDEVARLLVNGGSGCGWSCGHLTRARRGGREEPVPICSRRGALPAGAAACRAGLRRTCWPRASGQRMFTGATAWRRIHALAADGVSLRTRSPPTRSLPGGGGVALRLSAPELIPTKN